VGSLTKKIIAAVAGVIILIITLLYFYFRSYTPKYRWNENYRYDNVQPYGLKLAFDLFSDVKKRSNFVFINKSPSDFINKEDTSALYIFIGDNYVSDSAFSYQLAEFVDRGNNAFISSVSAEHYLFKLLTRDSFPFINYNYVSQLSIVTHFENDPHHGYKFDFKNGKKLTTYEWTGLDSIFLNDSIAMYGFEAVGNIGNGLYDCIRVKHGRGWFVFQSNPMFFTNYSLMKENGYNYLNTLLSDYRKPRILWDEFSKTPKRDQLGEMGHSSPLRFILSEKSLRWSWFLLCIFIVLFIIFNSKRKQAQIPLIPSNYNTSVEFINSIATLYFKNNSANYLAEEMMKQFLSFVKSKYGLSPNMNKKEIPERLSPLSGIPKEELESLFESYTVLTYGFEYETQTLIKLYNQIENFYQNCK
jgi:hypothetical protein